MATQEMMRRERERQNGAPAPAGKTRSRSSSIRVPELCEQIRRDRLVTRYPRQGRRNAIMQYVGKYYSEEGTMEEVPINLIALYISIVSRSLIAKNPRVMLSTFQKQNKPMVRAMQDWVNKEMENMQIAQVLQRWVIDGLFSFGILKIALATPSDAAHVSWNLSGGQPFAQTIDLDDFICDMNARDFSEVSYIGHRYRVPLDTVKDSKLYSRGRKNLVPSYDPVYNQEGDERVGAMTRTTLASNSPTFEDMVDLWEVYLPRHRLVLTLAADNAGNPMVSGYSDEEEVLRDTRWIGDDTGPYHILGFGTVPGNLFPKAPMQDLYDLHMTANNIYRKLTEQSRRLKQLLFFGSSAEGDAGRIQNASDGEILRIDHPDQIQQVSFGGPDQTLMAMFLDCVQRFSFMAGNLEMLGGLSPQSKTATQDKLLAANASGTMLSMQETATTAIAKALSSLCWYYHHDPYRAYKSTFSLPGMPALSVGRTVGPMDRQRVPWDEIEFRVDPYSMQMQTPQTRMMLLQQTIQQEVIPMMGLLQQQGIMLDLNAYLRKKGEYMDQPDLEEILTIAQPPQQEAVGAGETPPMPTTSDRQYTRISEPGRTQQGDTMNFMNALRGINPGGNPETTGEAQR